MKRKNKPEEKLFVVQANKSNLVSITAKPPYFKPVFDIITSFKQKNISNASKKKKEMVKKTGFKFITVKVTVEKIEES
jgi:hypothetical protein